MKTRARFGLHLSAVVLGSSALACGGDPPPPPATAAPSAVSAASASPPPVAASAAPSASPPPAAPPVDPQIDALVKSGLSSRESLAIVTSLSDEVGPRVVGSPGYTAAVAWAVRTMTKIGLANVHTEPVKAERWERVEESASLVSPGPQHIELAALGLSPSTPGAGIEAEVVEVDSLQALSALDPAKIKGKIVFFNKPMQRTRDGKGYGKAVDVRVNGPLAAAKAGAIGALVRSVTPSTERYAHTGAMRVLGAKGSPYEGVKAVPAAAIAVPDAEMLHRVIAASGAANATAARPVRVKLKIITRRPPAVTTFNVVGEIPGESAASNVLLFGAHLDSWDLATGAQDDGAGCAIVLEAARLLLANRVKSAPTLRVLLYAGEEDGIWGAKAYAAAHGNEVDHIVAALEADEGGDRVYALRVLGERGAAFDTLSQALHPLDIEALTDDAHGGSDTLELRPLGVPMIDLQQDMSRYFDIHHSKNDVVEQIDPPSLAQAATSYAVLGAVIGRADLSFGRAPAESPAAKPATAPLAKPVTK